MIDVQLGQDVIGSIRGMLAAFAEYPGNAARSIVFFALPAVVILWSYLLARKLAFRRGCTAIAAGLSPGLVLLVAWDLSRFLVAVVFSAMLVVLFIESKWQPERRQPALVLGWTLVPIYLAAPLVHAYFPEATIVQSGILPLEGWPIGNFLRMVFAIKQ